MTQVKIMPMRFNLLQTPMTSYYERSREAAVADRAGIFCPFSSTGSRDGCGTFVQPAVGMRVSPGRLDGMPDAIRDGFVKFVS